MPKAKVLIFAVSLPPVGRLTSHGAGMRALQLYQALRRAGHEVLVSADLECYDKEGCAEAVPPEWRKLDYRRRSQQAIYRETKPDLVVIASNWRILQGDWWPECPTVVDLNGPTFIEVLLQASREPASVQSALARKLELISRADLMLCGGQRQQWYFRHAATMAGVGLREPIPMALVPFGVDPAWVRPRAYPAEAVFVYGGGLYPWLDPALCIETVLDVIERRGKGRLRWIGPVGAFHATDVARSEKLMARLRSSARVSVSGVLPFAEFLESLRTSSISLELMAPTVERELALPTRTPLAMAAGLPILCGEYLEYADRLRSREAGWVVPYDRKALEAIIEELLEHPEEVERRGLRAQELAKSEFEGDKLAQPLVDFAARPYIRQGKRPIPFGAGLGGLTFWEARALQALRWYPVKWLRNKLHRFFVWGRKES